MSANRKDASDEDGGDGSRRVCRAVMNTLGLIIKAVAVMLLVPSLDSSWYVCKGASATATVDGPSIEHSGKVRR